MNLDGLPQSIRLRITRLLGEPKTPSRLFGPQRGGSWTSPFRSSFPQRTRIEQKIQPTPAVTARQSQLDLRVEALEQQMHRLEQVAERLLTQRSRNQKKEELK